MNATKITQEALEGLGGAYWEGYGKRRVYMNDLCRLYGLKINRYNTGNISSATLDGEEISNGQARKLIGLLGGKLYYDLDSGAWGSRDLGQDEVDVLVEEIEKRLEVDRG